MAVLGGPIRPASSATQQSPVQPTLLSSPGQRAPNLGGLSRLEWGARVLASALPASAAILLLASWPIPQPMQPYPFAASPLPRARPWQRKVSLAEQARQQERQQRILAAQRPLLAALADA